VCRVCRTWNRIATPLIYRIIKVNFEPLTCGDLRGFELLERALHKRPDLCTGIKVLRVKNLWKTGNYSSEEKDLDNEIKIKYILARLPKLEYIDMLDYRSLRSMVRVIVSRFGGYNYKSLKRIDLDFGEVTEGISRLFQLPTLEVLNLCGKDWHYDRDDWMSVRSTSPVRELSLTMRRWGLEQRNLSVWQAISNACLSLRIVGFALAPLARYDVQALSSVPSLFRSPKPQATCSAKLLLIRDSQLPQ
jgi:hypothetical protein